MNYKKHAQKQLEYLLEPYVFKETFPAKEAARLVLWLHGESVETIMSHEDVTKAARQKLFDLSEGKLLKRRAKNTRYVNRVKAKIEAINNDASLTQEEKDIKVLLEKYENA